MTDNLVMTGYHLIQVVSGFRPDVDGMGDYARHLAEELWRQSKITSTIVVFRRPETGTQAGNGDGWSVCYTSEASPEVLVAELQEQMRSMPMARLLLHYGPYAYTSNGIPMSFANEMARLGKDTPIVVFFHEMWAHGWPWRRAFWTRRSQIDAVRTLLAASRVGLSSSSLYLKRLSSMNEMQRPLAQVKIFSNMGSVEQPMPLQKRERRLVVFGQIATRVRLYRQFGRHLEKLCGILRLDSVLDVGSGESGEIPMRVGSLPVARMGFLSEAEASNLLATSVAGVLRYEPSKWEKSGVLASYQAHGMVPVIAPSSMEGFRPFEGMPFTLIGDLLRRGEPTREDEMQALADRAHGFYQREVSLARAAERIADAMKCDQ